MHQTSYDAWKLDNGEAPLSSPEPARERARDARDAREINNDALLAALRRLDPEQYLFDRGVVGASFQTVQFELLVDLNEPFTLSAELAELARKLRALADAIDELE